MDGYLRQSTASQSRLIGPFVSDTDFKTASTGLTIANTDIKLRANGTTLANKNSGGGTHQANGMYSVTFDATDTANVGELKYSVVVAGALQVFGSYVVLEEAVYDAMFAAAAPGYVDGATVNATKIGGTTQTGRDLGLSVLLSVGTATGQVNLSSGKVPATIAAGDIATDAVDANALKTDAVNEIRNAITGGAYALSTDANGRIRIVDGTGAGEVDTTSGLVQANVIQIAGVAQTAGDAVNMLFNMFDTVWNNVPGAQVTSSYGNYLERVFSRLGTPTDFGTGATVAANLADLSTLLGTPFFGPTFGNDFAAINDNVLQVGTAVAGVSSKIGNPVGATVSEDIANVPSLVWASGTRTLTALPSIPTDWLTAAGLAADAVVEIRNAITGGAYALATDSGGAVKVSDGTGAGQIDLTSGGVLVAALAAQAKADVNAEVVDALSTDTYAEPGQGAPGATISLADKIGFLFTSWRNLKTNDGTETKLFADNGTTVLMKQATTSSAGVVSKSEWITGA